jgi:hypothetical protein
VRVAAEGRLRAVFLFNGSSSRWASAPLLEVAGQTKQCPAGNAGSQGHHGRIAMQITTSVKEQAMSVPKIAVMLSLAGALSLVSHRPAQSAPLNSVSGIAKASTEQTNAVQVRWRRGWHNGARTPPYYYGGTYLGYTYGGFPGVHGHGYVFPSQAYGYRPYGWYWYSPY